MNKIAEYFTKFTDVELLHLVKETFEQQETGIITNGIRDVARELGDMTNGFLTTDYNTVTFKILREAARRWIDKK